MRNMPPIFHWVGFLKQLHDIEQNDIMTLLTKLRSCSKDGAGQLS